MRQEKAKMNERPRGFHLCLLNDVRRERGVPYQCRAPRKRGEALKRLREEKKSANTAEDGREIESILELQPTQCLGGERKQNFKFYFLS